MPAAHEEIDRQELHELLHAELARLPEPERAVLVLCYLQGKTNAEAATSLGAPPGSMSKRLRRARDMLRKRLAGKVATITATRPAMATCGTPASYEPQAIANRMSAPDRGLF